MGFSIKFDTNKSGWSIVYNKGSQVRVGVIQIVIVINCNLITFSKVIACNCN